ncbi:MAG: aminomethyl-transferring glycine dehydrogenase subunit GcvPA [Dehalococcoidia bacterium]
MTGAQTPQPDQAPTPYIATTPADRVRMLARIGAGSIEDLFAALPASVRDPAISLAPALSEAELVRFFRSRAAENRSSDELPSFLGAGAYRRNVPAVTAPLVARSEFATAYTPYQPEISQGTLQAAFEFQSVVCELTGMDVANTGLYDIGSATAEATRLAARATKRQAVALVEPLHPHLVDVIRTYAYGGDLRVDVIGDPHQVGDEHACLVVQQPDFLGGIRDVEPIAAAAHASGALCVVAADPLALGLLRAPGDAGADVVTGEGRDLAGPPSFGGPSLGLFAAKEDYLRQMPGRIVGRTKEVEGPLRADGSRAPARTGYVLTLQAREQFIRRERATSNFSTGQSLIALAFTISVQALGPQGLRRQAELCYQKAHDAAERVAALPGYHVVDRGAWFQEFLVQGPLPAVELRRRAASCSVVAGLDVSDRAEPEATEAILVCVTEATPEEHIVRLVDVLRTIGEEA